MMPGTKVFIKNQYAKKYYGCLQEQGRVEVLAIVYMCHSDVSFGIDYFLREQDFSMCN